MTTGAGPPNEDDELDPVFCDGCGREMGPEAHEERDGRSVVVAFVCEDCQAVKPGRYDVQNDFSFEADKRGPVLEVNGQTILLNTFVNLVDGPVEHFDTEADCGDGCWWSLVADGDDVPELSVEIMPEVRPDV